MTIKIRPGPLRWTVLTCFSKASGRPSYIQWEHCKPLLFETRRACAAFIRLRWGYMATRRDLRRAPHYWRMPQPIRVRVELVPVQNWDKKKPD